MHRDRFLTGILIGIGVLILLALSLFFLRQSQVPTINENTPSGVLQSYFLAVQQQDYETAYTFLAQGSGQPTFLSFQEPFLTFQADQVGATPVEIGEEIIDEQTGTASVQITLVRGGRGIFEDVYRESQIARLVFQGDSWKIVSLPYPYWSYDWLGEITPEPVPTITNTPP